MWHHANQKENKNSSPPSLKRDFENAYICFWRFTLFRGWTSYCSSNSNAIVVAAAVALQNKTKMVLKKEPPTLVSVHRMVVENRPVDPGSIQGSHRPVSFMIEHRTRADDILC